MVDNKVQQLVVCVEEIRQWMNANRLRLNEDKTQFIWLGTPHRLSEVQCQKISLTGVDIQILTEVTCFGVLLDSKLTFAPHVRRLSGRCFYHIRQLKTVRRSLTEDAAKSLVHAFVTSRIYYCNSVIYGARAAHIQPLQNVLNSTDTAQTEVRPHHQRHPRSTALSAHLAALGVQDLSAAFRVSSPDGISLP